jgi:hypothetical protein
MQTLAALLALLALVALLRVLARPSTPPAPPEIPGYVDHFAERQRRAAFMRGESCLCKGTGRIDLGGGRERWCKRHPRR